MVPKIDKQGNLVYNQTGLVYTSGEDSILQTLTNRLRLLRGEAINHPTDGMDYNNLMSHNNLNLIKREISSELKKDSRVIYSTIETKRQSEGQLVLQVKVKSRYEQ